MVFVIKKHLNNVMQKGQSSFKASNHPFYVESAKAILFT